MHFIDVPDLQAPLDGAHHATVAGDKVFCSMQLGVDRVTGNVVAGLPEQLRMALTNIASILDLAGVDPRQVVQMTVFMRDTADATHASEVIREHFVHAPSLSLVQMSDLPAAPGAQVLVGIDAVAAREPQTRIEPDSASAMDHP